MVCFVDDGTGEGRGGRAGQGGLVRRVCVCVCVCVCVGAHLISSHLNRMRKVMSFGIGGWGCPLGYVVHMPYAACDGYGYLFWGG